MKAQDYDPVTLAKAVRCLENIDTATTIIRRRLLHIGPSAYVRVEGGDADGLVRSAAYLRELLVALENTADDVSDSTHATAAKRS